MIMIDSGKGKEPMPVDEDDRRLDNDDLMANESVLGNMNPSKRRCTQFMIQAQTKPIQATNADDEMGLHIFDSRDLMEGDTQMIEGQEPAVNRRGPRTRRHTGHHRKNGARAPNKNTF